METCEPEKKRPSGFRRWAQATAEASGNPLVFLAAIGCVVAWALTGRWFGYSDTWQLVINTGTSVVTFLMVFLIQNSQNRDSKAVQIKLDELIRAVQGAENQMIKIEETDDEELKLLCQQYEDIRKQMTEVSKRDRHKEAVR